MKDINRLYWVWTDDHDEDWFVVARSNYKAKKFFEDYEGYDRGDAKAKQVTQIPHFLCNMQEPSHPHRSLLHELGGEYKRCTSPRVVKFKGETYAEGMLQSVVEEDDR